LRGDFLRVAPSRERKDEKSLAIGNCEAPVVVAGDMFLLVVFVVFVVSFYENAVWDRWIESKGLAASAERE
jgi:hypothetical protein